MLQCGDLATAATIIAITLAAACPRGIARRALIISTTPQPKTIPSVGSNPAPFAHLAAFPPAVAFLAAAVVSPVPAGAGLQCVSSFGEISGHDSATAVVGTGAAAGAGGEGYGELGRREEEGCELHGDVSRGM